MDVLLYEHPLTTPLNKLIHQHAQISKQEATDVEAEELAGMTGAEFEADVRRGGVLEAWVFDLAGYLIFTLHNR
jgi:hypothetical protein